MTLSLLTSIFFTYLLEIVTLNGSETSNTSILVAESSRKRPIHHHHFKIEGEAFMIALHDGEEPNTYNKAPTSYARIYR